MNFEELSVPIALSVYWTVPCSGHPEIYMVQQVYKATQSLIKRHEIHVKTFSANQTIQYALRLDSELVQQFAWSILRKIHEYM